VTGENTASGVWTADCVGPEIVTLELVGMALLAAVLLATELGVLNADVSAPEEVATELLPPTVCITATLVLPTPTFTK